ncbi:glycine betaine transporter subunit; ATP-binding compoent of ABC superfamily [Candidatus Desulfarcum epimagneticum]|uniref:Glycine betaine transporter subunit ATP-binding compoent of ABC superfamily n=1 Tax=uncultured Desulfobacteraceae bacterium TaxID=218296 RepID=A0A484HKV4_9BACT|nr:glycine betaine transporter subunit; ATP-binding compoent of ABC superfamily [uncultured Desulfobacteraceae bacterium]
MSDPDEKVVVKNLFKVFGAHPEKAVALANSGMGKDEVFAKTGLSIGVNNASFSVREGEIFVVMGLSGSGKSTLIRMINRLIRPTSGAVFFEGKDVAKMRRDELTRMRREKMSMVFQSFALMPHMTVLKNAAFALEISEVPEKDRERRAMEALDQVGLKPYAQSRPDELSGGMRQRVGLARALAADPCVMLMDEAFSALDPLIRTEMQDELLKLQAEKTRAIVFISHDLDEAMRIGDRIAIMEGGRIVQTGSPEEILRNPADDYVRAFFRGVDPTNILTAGQLAEKKYATITRRGGEGPRVAIQRIRDRDRGPYAYALDRSRRFLGVVSADSLGAILGSDMENSLESALIHGATAVKSDSVLQDAAEMIIHSDWAAPVVDDDNRYMGAISKNRFLRALSRNTS